MYVTTLNRKIRNVLKRHLKLDKNPSKDMDFYYVEIEKIKKEAHDLYLADSGFKSMSRQSVLILFRLNLMYRFRALHQFGLNIELKEL